MKRAAQANELDDAPVDPALVRIARMTSRPDDGELIEQIARASFPDHRFDLDDELGRPWTRLWVARAASPPAQPLGFVIAWHVADELHVLSIATAPPHRRRGIGAALMMVAIEYAAAERVRLVLLEVRRSNRAALRLYRALGFTAMGVRPRYYADNEEDALEMVLTLDVETGRIVPGRDEVRFEV